MSDEGLKLRRELDVLLSAFTDKLTMSELADLLFATANGLATRVGERPAYNAAERVLELPFTEASALEGELEALLTTRVICVEVTGVPLLAAIGVRIVCGRESVDLAGRAVQETTAGTVIQLNPATVDTQRALLSLPAVLRSNPTEAPSVNRRAIRQPDLTDPDIARRSRLPPSPPVVAAPPTPNVSDEFANPASRRVTLVMAAPKREVDPADRLARSRLGLNAPRIEAAVARIVDRSHFDFLSVHFSADTEAVTTAIEGLRELINQCREDDREGDLAPELDRLGHRIAAAAKALCDPPCRRKHRAQVISTFQIETAIEMYEGQATAAMLSRKVDVALDCYRRIIELDPSNGAARTNMQALLQLLQG